MSYLTTNRLTLRGYMWRTYLIVLGVGILALIAGSYRITSTNTLEKALASEPVQQAIDYIGSEILTDEQSITLSGDSMIAAPETITIDAEVGGYIGIDTTIDCTTFFNTTESGILATSKALCINDGRQQIVTWEQINTARLEAGSAQDFDPSYPTINSLLTQENLTIDASMMTDLSDELARATQDPDFLTTFQEIASMIRRPLMLGLGLAWIFISIILTVIMIIMPVAIAALLTQITAKVAGHSISYETAFSRSRLPASIILLLTWLIPGLPLRIGAIVFLIFPIMIARQQTTTPTA